MNTKKLILLFASLLLLLSFAFATPTTTLTGCNPGWNNSNQTITLNCTGSLIPDSNQIDQNSSYSSVTGQTYIDGIGSNGAGQSFTPTQTSINKITLSLAKKGTPPDLNISIATYTVGYPVVGTILYTKKFVTTGLGLQGIGTYIDANFDVNVTGLTPGNTYAIVLKTNGGDSSNGIYVPWNTSGTYTGGQFITSDDGINWGNQTGFDTKFSTYYFSPSHSATCTSIGYRVDSSGAFTNYTTPFILGSAPYATDGNHKIDFNSTDNVPSTEATKTSYCAIDKTPPTVGTPSVSGFRTYGAYIDNNLIDHTSDYVYSIASDSNSGLDGGAQYTINNGSNWLTATLYGGYLIASAEIPITNGTTYTFNTRINDNAGNVGTGTATSTYTGDTLAPTTTMSYTIPDGNNTATITLTCTDAASGCASTKYEYDTNGTWYTYTTPITFTGIGHHYIDYNSTDNIGNAETPHHADLNMPVLLTIKEPLDQILITPITTTWYVQISGATTLNYLNLSNDKNAYLKYGTNYITISDTNGLYSTVNFTRTYYTDSNSGYNTIQPYMLLKTVAPQSFIKTQSLSTLLPIPNVNIKAYTQLLGVNTLVADLTTDTSGSSSIAMIINQVYTWQIYYLGNLISTQTIVGPISSGQTFYININDQTGNIVPVGNYGFDVNFTPQNPKLHKYDSILSQMVSLTDTNHTVIVSNITITVTNLDSNGVDGNNVLLYTDSNPSPTMPFTNNIPIDYLTNTLNSVPYDQNGSLLVTVLITTNYGTKTASYTYQPVNGLDFLQSIGFDIRPMMGCSATNNPLIPCAPLMLAALFVSMVIAVCVAAGSGYLSMTSIGGLFIFVMGVFTYIAWVPYVIFAIMLAGVLALMIAEGGRRI